MVASLNGHAPAMPLQSVEIDTPHEAVLTWGAGEDFAGTVVRVYTSINVSRMLEVLRAPDKEELSEDTSYLYEQRLLDFARYNLIEWNLAAAARDADGALVLDEHGQKVLEPIPTTYEALMHRVPSKFIDQLLLKFAEEVAGVARPLGIASSNGAPSEAPSETTEPSSPSQRRSRRRNSSNP